MPSAVVEPIFARHATLQWWLWWPDRIIAVYLCNNHMCICATLIPRCAWFAYSNIYLYITVFTKCLHKMSSQNVFTKWPISSCVAICLHPAAKSQWWWWW
jgi:hypothetical protein